MQTSAQNKKPKKRKTPQDYSRLNRNCQVKIRLTAQEKAALKDAANNAGLCLADYVMACVQGKTIIRIPEVAQLRMELLREGRNLNQILHMAYVDRKAGKNVDWESIFSAKVKVESNLDMLYNLIRKWDADITEQSQDGKTILKGE